LAEGVFGNLSTRYTRPRVDSGKKQLKTELRIEANRRKGRAPEREEAPPIVSRSVKESGFFSGNNRQQDDRNETIRLVRSFLSLVDGPEPPQGTSRGVQILMQRPKLRRMDAAFRFEFTNVGKRWFLALRVATRVRADGVVTGALQPHDHDVENRG